MAESTEDRSETIGIAGVVERNREALLVRKRAEEKSDRFQERLADSHSFWQTGDSVRYRRRS